MKTLDWFGLHGESWGQEISSESYSHPAKYARALIRRIYEHALERGWLAEGDEVLDPFAGVGLGAADALALGLNWTGNELEAHFVDMGQGCECGGISKDDWRCCFGRWKRFAHRDGRHWCPRCLAEAEKVIEPRPPALPGMGPPPIASYERDSGKIPHTEPHHYAGNLELFAKHARNGARAVLLQGDSRNLLAVLGGGARAQACVSSPPYVNRTVGSKTYNERMERLCQKPIESLAPRWQREVRKYLRRGQSTSHCQITDEGYGADPANLGNMREGDYAAVVSSPAYADGCAHTGGDDPKPEHVKGGELHFVEYGQSAGQLGAMATGDVDAVISSPPFAGILNDKRCGGGIDESKRKHDRKAGPRGQTNVAQSYGQSPGQLAAMPEGAFEADAVVSSPPFEQTQGFHDKEFSDQWGPKQLRTGTPMGYGESLDNLGNTQGDTFWSAARQIVEQCWLALAPGGYAVWVLKAFVRNKAIVDFPDQWRRTCEACGFETVEWIRAWLVEDRGAQWALDGELIEKEVRRESFFRRLHRQKYPELSIDFEVVLVMRKAEAI